MAKHTPGKWFAASREGDDWDSVVPVEGTSSEICQCFHASQRLENLDECEANARLVAAAPELLEALKELRDRIPEPPNGWPELDRVKRADSAVAKAEGRQ